MEKKKSTATTSPDNLPKAIAHVPDHMGWVLHTLFSIPAFRKVYNNPSHTPLKLFYLIYLYVKEILNIDTRNDEKMNIVLALQRLFYRLQFNDREDNLPGVSDFAEAKGVDESELFEPQDASEYYAMFTEDLQADLKQRPSLIKNIAARFLEVEFNNHIKCLNIDYGASRIESDLFGTYLQKT